MKASTFDGLKDGIATLCAGRYNLLTSISKTIAESNELSDPSKEKMLRSILSVNNGLEEIRILSSQLYEKAVFDPIGLHSKAYLEDSISLLQGEENLAFLIGDVDKFKMYNDLCGHLQGDIALKHIAQEFKNSIMENLCAFEYPIIARYGGEELCAFIIKFNRDVFSINDLAEKIRTNIEKMEIPGIQGVNYENDYHKHKTITIATGIRNAGESIQSFMYEVDKLLTQKDNMGRNKVYSRD